MRFHTFNKNTLIYQGFATAESKPFDNCTELEPTFSDGFVTKFIEGAWVQEEIIVPEVDPLEVLKGTKMNELQTFFDEQKALIGNSTLEELEALNY